MIFYLLGFNDGGIGLLWIVFGIIFITLGGFILEMRFGLERRLLRIVLFFITLFVFLLGGVVPKTLFLDLFFYDLRVCNNK